MQDSIPTLISVTLGLLVAVMGYVTVRLDRRTKKLKQTQEDDKAEIKAKQAARDLELETVQEELERAKSDRRNLESLVDAVKVMAGSFLEQGKAQIATMREFSGEIHGNAEALTSNTETLGELKDSMDKLASEVRAALALVATYPSDNEAFKKHIQQLIETQFTEIAEALASFTRTLKKLDKIPDCPAPDEPANGAQP